MNSAANGAATTVQPCDKGGTDIGAIASAASNAAFDARAVQFGGKPLCWWSGDHGGYGWDDDASRRDSRRKKRVEDKGRRRGGVVMFGSGCAGCVAGQWCSFEIEIRPPAKWVFPVTEAFLDYLIVELWGPSIAYADVKREGSDNKRWKVSYRVWDAGEYTATVTSGCSTLNYTSRFAQQGIEPFANWTLSVSHPFANDPSSLRDFAKLPANPLPNPESGTKKAGKRGKAGGEAERILAQGAGGAEGEAEGGDWREEAEVEWTEAPCDQAVAGRWLYVEDAYRWRFYPCAAPLPPPSQWVEALQERGIREISFVGDSHQRFLMLFINYLVMHDVDDALWKYHGDIVINLPPPKKRRDLQPLRLNFYWVDGMYQNDEYGCIRRGFWSHRNNTFPDLSKSADVTIIDGGFWATCNCKQAEQAFSKHLPEYVAWARRQLDRLQLWHGKHRGNGNSAGANGKPWMLYRSIVPWRASGECGGLIPTNSLIEHMNAMIKAEIRRYGIGYLDGWPVEAPRYFDTCSEKDLHYTCHRKEQGTKNGMFFGDVGQAMVDNTLHNLLYKLW
ncbi:hypothetical protein CLOM_g1113 [Closterium sp. NIES-68]|nr:hypothetical protein CLOM_g1113 [Closterium sp. NIES-68]GJP62104.1 hypothetical protein CLOP_g19199 [Closterium sp. NIES-67]